MVAKIKYTDYLYATARSRALEQYLLTPAQRERMLDARSNEEAMKVLLECGYPEIAPVTVDVLDQALSQQRQRVFEDIRQMAPDPVMLDIFHIKYDYHNAKVLLKAEAMGEDPSRLLVSQARVPVAVMRESVLEPDDQKLPSLLGGAIAEAARVLHTTRDPQLADFILDRAYFQELLDVTQKTGSQFLVGYVRLLIDIANLRAVVRTVRMGKDEAFLERVLVDGGNFSIEKVLEAFPKENELKVIYVGSPLYQAAQAGMSVLHEGKLTRFEKVCDDTLIAYWRTARHVAFGEPPLLYYAAAKEAEFTAVRIIITGRLAGLGSEAIRERLRESYV